VVGTGTPEDLAENPRSYTGRYLRRILEASAARRESERRTPVEVPA
jgi:excinuclease ABC subunit A